MIWRKLSFGSDSERGARFAERVLTAVATLKTHGRDVRGFLTKAVAAYRRGVLVPSFLPAPA